VLSKDASFCEACSRLPEILSYPEKFPVQQLSHLFEPEAESTASCGRDGIDSMMQEVSQRFCCNPSAAGRRALTITITITKAAATNGNVDSDAVARMLSSYAAYKSAALRAIRSIHGDDEADKTSFVAGVLTRIYS
jgi:hypothetical protein